ncbi:hypothetical protein CEN44_23035 [Fischerella muscicola CCMEE 5323]|uniref:Uncharacterized protein n=2 Tax=Hapalosiphonaceae TaxID=1892263 RepID=A0A2N6JXF7_FISMU|nr:hypothetical protein [Fischerella sp. FACHB-380]PLZ85138.1 hypothetical protein CEN44_23035 [Fischerella muscicola CCMEE 5323]
MSTVMIKPQYTDKNSTQTPRQGLEEYYALNPGVSDPHQMPADFAKIMMAHDVTHVVFGCDTNMYDELRLLPLTFIVSDYKFRDYLRDRQHPAVEVMYNDLVEHQGLLWLYTSILAVLPRFLPALVVMWFKNRGRKKFWPYFDYEPLFERSLLDIRREFDILQN